MVVDSSALVAILLFGLEAPAFVEIVHDTREALLSAANYVETGVLIGSRQGPGGLYDLDQLIESADIDIVPVTRAQAVMARDGYLRFGRGHHPAALNFGDCFAYALAKERDLPLLFKGDDFTKTDVRPAL